MKLFINTSTQPRRVLSEVQAFYDTPVEMPKALADRILAIIAEGDAVSRYLRNAEALVTGRNDYDITTMEVPTCLQDAVRKESPPSKKATAPRSKKKSPKKLPKTALKPATSPLKPESSG